MKKILIPTDFSKVAESALIVAREIARKNMATVELLHIIDAPYEEAMLTSGEVSKPDQMDRLFVVKSMEDANKKLHQIMNDAKYAGVRFKQKVKIGKLSHEFTNFINEEKPDLIIVGTEGDDGFFKGIFNNSHAEQVITHAESLVLSVKKADESFKIRNLVLATDFKSDRLEFINEIIQLQKLFDFKLHIVYVNALLGNQHPLEEIENEKNAFLKRYEIENFEFHIIQDFTEYSGIIQYAEKVKADVIALSSHQHRGLHFLGGISEDLVNCSEFSILTYKAIK